MLYHQVFLLSIDSQHPLIFLELIWFFIICILLELAAIISIPINIVNPSEHIITCTNDSGYRIIFMLTQITGGDIHKV